MAASINDVAPFMVHGELKAFLLNARQIEDAKKAALDVETKALDLLLGEICLNMHFLESEGNDLWCRESLVLIDKTQEIPFGERGVVEVDDKLTLYEDERLTRSTVVTIMGIDSTGRYSIVLPDEKDITTSKAIEHFGFNDICEGIIWLIKDRLSSATQLNDCRARIQRADTLLAAVRAEISAFGTLGGGQPCSPTP